MAVRIEGIASAGVSGRWVRKWANAAAKALKRGNHDIAVVFLAPARMKRLNGSYRGRPVATDILSFPAGSDRDLGDIFIAPPVAKKKAAERGMGYREYLKLLIVHGVLHLGGHDHVRKADAEAMEKAEDSILNGKA